eukprot:TRINITY_DN1943_c1_g2_i1.p1 TRINITY_DN1943_c1_g2~~TRINITY_DN1943_c1_g2_i1.p1  ORF type:complete len:319 (+),score=87.37 TRINITY_DN1943_c1_g2_i1:119-958(+)
MYGSSSTGSPFFRKTSGLGGTAVVDTLLQEDDAMASLFDEFDTHLMEENLVEDIKEAELDIPIDDLDAKRMWMELFANDQMPDNGSDTVLFSINADVPFDEFVDAIVKYPLLLDNGIDAEMLQSLKPVLRNLRTKSQRSTVSPNSFNTFLHLFGGTFSAKTFEAGVTLINQAWFHGYVSKDTVVEQFADCGNHVGLFVVRLSLREQGCFICHSIEKNSRDQTVIVDRTLIPQTHDAPLRVSMSPDDPNPPAKTEFKNLQAFIKYQFKHGSFVETVVKGE